MRRRRRGDPVSGQHYCPSHGISVSSRPTYIYQEKARNFIIDAKLALGIPKVEAWRLGYETSEDALTWNVFRSLQCLGGLRSFLELATGVRVTEEPDLYLWGSKIGEVPSPWDALNEVRKDLESGFSIPTEPDVAVESRDQVLLLCEAKLTSGNSLFRGKTQRFGSLGDFLARYDVGAEEADPLDRSFIERQDPDVILEQLIRNAVFAARIAKPPQLACLVNLVPAGREVDVERRFLPYVTGPRKLRFKRITWEEIYLLPEVQSPDGSRLRTYLERKTTNLRPAFQLH